MAQTFGLNSPALRNRTRLPIALTIAGSDSGGGAGLQADLKTFAALGVHGTTVVTCMTAQNPRRVWAIEAASPKMIRAQLQALFEELPPTAAKTGMLYSPETIRIVAETFSSAKAPPLVVDPVMVSTSRASLLKPAAKRALMDKLLCRATLITPNLDETAALLSGAKIDSVEAMRSAAHQIQVKFGTAVLVKGGHLETSKKAIDILYDGREEWLLEAPLVRGVSTHGTGCTYSAAITAFLARGYSLQRSVVEAKKHITSAIAASYWIGRHQGLNSFWRSRPGKFA